MEKAIIITLQIISKNVFVAAALEYRKIDVDCAFILIMLYDGGKNVKLPFKCNNLNLN